MKYSLYTKLSHKTNTLTKERVVIMKIKEDSYLCNQYINGNNMSSNELNLTEDELDKNYTEIPHEKEQLFMVGATVYYESYGHREAQLEVSSFENDIYLMKFPESGYIELKIKEAHNLYWTKQPLI